MRRFFWLVPVLLLTLAASVSAALSAGTAPNAQEGLSETPPVRTVRVNGAELSYVEQGQGEPVVLIHGFALDYREWSEQWPELSRRFRVIAYSRRNHYPNTWTDDGSDLSFAQHTADLVALIKTLDLGRAHLIGHSGGAGMAAEVARDHPELVRSLVLGEPVMRAVLARSPEAQSLPPPTFFEDVLKAFQRGNDNEAFRILIDGISGKEGAYDEMPPARRRWLLDNARSAEAELAAPDDCRAFTCEDAETIQVPTLLLQGDRTRKLFRLASQELHKCMPGSEYAVLPDAPHSLQLANPTGFNEIVLEFLGRHSSRARP